MFLCRRDGLLVATRGFQTFVKAGTPADTDFAAGVPGNGTIVADGMNNKLWVRLGDQHPVAPFSVLPFVARETAGQTEQGRGTRYHLPLYGQRRADDQTGIDTRSH